jgi:hypothetical protein
MPKVTVYVPEDLKARMDSHGDAVNWSHAAQHAFERAVAEREARMQPEVTDMMVARLRLSKQAYEEQQREEGRGSGRDWAIKTADYGELERLDHAFGGEGTDWAAVTAREVVEVVTADHVTWNSVSEWWEENAGVEGNIKVTDAYAAGFVEGALEAFGEVKDRL